MVRVAVSRWPAAAGEGTASVAGDEGAADSGGEGPGFAADVHRLRLPAQHQRDDPRATRELTHLLNRDTLTVVQHRLSGPLSEVVVAHRHREGDRFAAVFGELVGAHH